MRAQRDKILKIKKKARAHQLNESLQKNERPSSAQIAQKVPNSFIKSSKVFIPNFQQILDGEAGEVVKDSPASSEALQLRQTLARRLRKDVVDAVDS